MDISFDLCQTSSNFPCNPRKTELLMGKILFLLFGIVLIIGDTVSTQAPQHRTGNVQSEDEIRITVLQGDLDGYPFFVSINSSLKESGRKSELP
jgi:hypothetical protein